MKAKAKIIFSVLGVGIMLIGTGLTLTHYWLQRTFEPERIQAQLETWWNCRVSLDSSELSLWTQPSRIEIRGVKLFPKQLEGDPREIEALVTVESATLNIKLQHLLQKKFVIDELILQSMQVTHVIDEEGKDGLEQLFAKPEISDHQNAIKLVAIPNSMLETESPDVQTDALSTQKLETVTQSKSGFYATDLHLSLLVKKAKLLQAEYRHVDSKRQQSVHLQNLDLEFSEIDIHPTKLQQHNSSQITLAANLHWKDDKAQQQWLNVKLQGTGKLNPFDVATGRFSPRLQAQVQLMQGSEIAGMPLQEVLRDKDQENLREYGVDLSVLALGGVLQNAVNLKFHLTQEKLQFRESIVLPFDRYQLELDEKNWVNFEEQTQRFQGKICVDAALSEKILSDAEVVIAERYGKTLTGLAVKALQQVLMDEQKRLFIPFRSKGALKEPEVKVDLGIAEVKKNLKSSGLNILGDLFGN